MKIRKKLRRIGGRVKYMGIGVVLSFVVSAFAYLIFAAVSDEPVMPLINEFNSPAPVAVIEEKSVKLLGRDLFCEAGNVVTDSIGGETDDIIEDETADEPVDDLFDDMEEAPDDVPLETNTVIITVAGDCTLGGDYNSNAHERFEECYDKNGPEYFLSNFSELFGEDDITVVNLEGPLTTSNDKRRGRKFNFKGRSEFAKILSSNSVEGAGLANNHALDFGKSGISDTAKALEDENVGAYGFENVWYTEANGVKCAFISVTIWDYTTEELVNIVTGAKEQSDLAVVMIHWGDELVYETTKVQRECAHALIEAGADLIIGSHSHVVGGLEVYNGKYILYSTGNFCFGGSSSPTDYDCVVFRQTFRVTENGVSDGGIALVPCRVSSNSKKNNYQPMIAEGDAAQRILKKIFKYSDIDKSMIRWDPMMDKYIGEAE